MALCGDWLWSAVQWSMPVWKKATLTFYYRGSSFQQYENKINKATVKRGEKNEESWQKNGKGAYVKENKQETWQNKTRKTKSGGLRGKEKSFIQ